MVGSKLKVERDEDLHWKEINQKDKDDSKQGNKKSGCLKNHWAYLGYE